MPKKMFKIIPIIMLCALMVSCATAPPQATYSPLHDAATTNLIPKVNNFLVVLDSSYSMSESYMGKKKLALAQDAVSRMNRTLPPLDIKGALRTFGGGYCPFSQKTDLIYGFDNYSGPDFEQALAPVAQAGGPSPLASTITAAGADLAQTSGPAALLVFSDGKDMDDAPAAAASALKQKLGDRLCIYTVLIGNDTKGADLLNKIAKTGDCGFATRADDLAGQDQMDTFVEKVFFTNRPDTDGDGVYDDLDKCPDTPAGVTVDKDGCPLDSDGDGVYDYLDKCPGTPAGVIVDSDGCPLDSDGDGVYDYLDKCPGTPKNVAVDSVGCPLDSDKDGVYDYLDKCPNTPAGAKVNAVGCWVLAGILFDTDKSDLKPSMVPIVDEVVAILKKNTAIKVQVQGHTDNRGTKNYNQGLSERRAATVTDYLIQNGIAADRLTSAGYGFSIPVTSNDTDEGRAQNRRVELNPAN